MPDWLIGFIAGVIATIFGFVLTMLWDTYKLNRDAKKTEEAVLKAVKEELDNNASVLNDNLSLLKQELKVIEKQSIIIPLVTLQSGYWDLIKIHFPKKFEDVNVLNKIRNIAQLTDKINTSIISRESYRIHNQGMTNYTTRLRIYDDDLVENTEKLIDSIGSWDNF